MLPRHRNPASRPINLKLGRLLATPGAIQALQRSQQDPLEFIERHRHGDWGDVDEHDRMANDDAVAREGNSEQQSRVLSAYVTSAGDRIWLITEADRASTCLLLPSEY
jgi:hypothetical protein